MPLAETGTHAPRARLKEPKLSPVEHSPDKRKAVGSNPTGSIRIGRCGETVSQPFLPSPPNIKDSPH